MKIRSQLALLVVAVVVPVASTLLVAVTGYGTPEDRRHALATGFDGFLVKPFDIEAFERLVGEKVLAA